MIRPVVAKANPLTLRFMEVTTHGYGLMEFTAERLTVSYISPTTITKPDAPSTVLAKFEVDRGAPRIRQVAGAGFMPRTVPDDPSATTTTTAPDGSVPGDVPDAGGATPVPGTSTFTG